VALPSGATREEGNVKWLDAWTDSTNATSERLFLYLTAAERNPHLPEPVADHLSQLRLRSR